MITEKQLRDWWFETNGSGTSACPDCIYITEHVCTWHKARLDDLLEMINDLWNERVDSDAKKHLMNSKYVSEPQSFFNNGVQAMQISMKAKT